MNLVGLEGTGNGEVRASIARLRDNLEIEHCCLENRRSLGRSQDCSRGDLLHINVISDL
jgi:hypothetical protein